MYVHTPLKYIHVLKRQRFETCGGVGVENDGASAGHGLGSDSGGTGCL
jgi:hypothetical protein